MCQACALNGRGASWSVFDHDIGSGNGRGVSAFQRVSSPHIRGDFAISTYASMAQGFSLDGVLDSIGDAVTSTIDEVYDWLSDNISSLPLSVFSIAAEIASHLPEVPIFGTKYYLPDDADPNVLALMSGSQWAKGTVTYSFPDSKSDFSIVNPSAYGYKPLSFEGQQGVRYALEGASPSNGQSKMTMTSVASFTNLKFQYTGTNDADIRVSGFEPGKIINRSHAYYPGIPFFGGDTWLKRAGSQAGSLGNMTVLHELGHALGLKHPFDAGLGQSKLPGVLDNPENTVMTYNNYLDSAQTFMRYDIAALQQMYGANYSTNSGNTIYKWDGSTGETFVNGVGQGQPNNGKIFLTIWDGGGTDTYDMRNFDGNSVIDLNPGESSKFSLAQLARGNSDTAFAASNVYNAFQYGSSTRSLIENAIGGSGNDRILGNQAANELDGGSGNDILYGGAGRDTLYGGAGHDRLYGEAGDDVIAGGDGLDTIVGGDGSDLVYGEAGNDYILGEAGVDHLGGGAGDDVLSGGADGDYLYGEDGHDTLYGDAGNDILYGQAGNDVLGGGAGDDQLSGGDGVDVLWGEDGNDALGGDAGDDHVHGGAGQDSLYGGSGNDSLYGEAGDDVIAGGDGFDTIVGGDGSDLVYGEAGNDYILGEAGVDHLGGGAGDDVLSGGLDNDFLYGGEGHDVAYGDAGHDKVAGEAGNDSLFGGDGDDQLYGGTGMDMLTGGSGWDWFVFETALDGVSNVDRITDFDVARDGLFLNRAIFGGFGAKVSLAYGDKANAAQAQIVYKSTTGELFYDADGTGAAAQVKFAVLGANLALTQDHFIL